nr:MAG TPA: tail fiber protein [Caudoviricetes sp.]
MLVSNEISKNQYVGDGSVTEFAYTFPILDSTHIEVYRQLSTETAFKAKLVPAEEYTVEGAGAENGGKVVFKTAPSSGTKLSILRNVPVTQLYQYQELDSFPAESHENALAKLTMICQEIDERLDRAIVVSPTDTVTPDELRNDIFEASQEAKDSAAAAKDSETAAAASETAAANSASAAASSENNAAASASAAAVSAQNAASSESNAASSETAAAASETAAANSAAAILELKIEVNTLNPGEQATASYDPVTGILTLGIPKGDSGAAAIATPTSLGSVMPQTGDADGLELETNGKLRVRKASASQRGSVLASTTAAANTVPQAGEDGTLDESWFQPVIQMIDDAAPGVASKDTLGLIKVGSGLAIRADGFLDVISAEEEVVLTSSNHAWIVPETAVYTVTCIGGGGKGGTGGSTDYYSTAPGAGGGGGGASIIKTTRIALTAGDSIAITVGGPGGASSFGSYLTSVAGAAGGNANGSTPGSAGSNEATSGAVGGGSGSKVHTGGRGGTGAPGFSTAVSASGGGGGGGSSMGSAYGGAGGAGGKGYGAGGGGGGGAGEGSSDYSGGAGGNGAPGVVIINYVSAQGSA